MKRKVQDEISWFQGLYDYNAFMTALSHFGSGLAGKHSNAEYLKKPFLQSDDSEPKYKESNEQIALFEMKQRIKRLQTSGLPESPS